MLMRWPHVSPQGKYKEVKARNAQLLKMLGQGESEYGNTHTPLLFGPSCWFSLTHSHTHTYTHVTSFICEDQCLPRQNASLKLLWYKVLCLTHAAALACQQLCIKCIRDTHCITFSTRTHTYSHFHTVGKLPELPVLLSLHLLTAFPILAFPVKDKAEILLQVDELLNIKEELSSEVGSNANIQCLLGVNSRFIKWKGLATVAFQHWRIHWLPGRHVLSWFMFTFGSSSISLFPLHRFQCCMQHWNRKDQKWKSCSQINPNTRYDKTR